MPYILWQLYFPTVFKDNGGFDIIVGNPPYGAKFSSNMKAALNRIFNNSYVPDYESSDFFIELGYKLLKTQGILSFIAPNMFMANIFAKKYREHLLYNWSIQHIDNFSDVDVFDNAKVRKIAF